jgi:hypothetical protein
MRVAMTMCMRLPLLPKYLSPQQVAAWHTLATVNGSNLAKAFDLYIKTHQRGKEPRFVAKQRRDWNTLITVVGDIEFKDLSREHARHVVDVLRKQGKKTTTVRRTITTLSAVTMEELVRSREFGLG